MKIYFSKLRATRGIRVVWKNEFNETVIKFPRGMTLMMKYSLDFLTIRH